MKKLISVVLCLAMLASCFALFASADATTLPAAPEVDGVVNEGEYTSSKVYSDPLQFQNSSAVVTITEYVAHDEDYVYFALVYDEVMSKVEIEMNGATDVRYDWDSASEYGWFTFVNIDEDGAAAGFTGYNFGVLDYVACAKIADGKTTAEVKISKESMLTAYEVESVDYFGYYTLAWTAEDNTRINNATYLANPKMEACGFANLESDIEATYELGPWYNTEGWQLMNIVVLGDETLPETPANYCPADAGCADANHATRAEVFDLADLRDFDLLPGHFVPAFEIQAPATDAPATDAPATDAPATDAPATDAPATDATTAATTAAATTEAPKSGCGKSIALSALAIVPVLGLGVAFVSKKKED